MTDSSWKIRVTLAAANGLSKRDVFRQADPFAVITVDGSQTNTTSVIKATSNPCWNEAFDITVKDSSLVGVRIFDQRKFKRKDQGFLGEVNVRVSDILDFELGGHKVLSLDLKGSTDHITVRGKLTIAFSINTQPPISNFNPDPSQAAGLTVLSELGLNGTSPSGNPLSVTPTTEDSQRHPSRPTSLPTTTAVSNVSSTPSTTQPGSAIPQTNTQMPTAVTHSTRDSQTNADPTLKTVIMGPSRGTPQPQSISQLGPLPSGWEMRHISSTRVYFINHNTKTTTWDDPRLSSSLDSNLNLPQYKREEA